MFGSITGPPPPPSDKLPYTQHELGQVCDYLAGLVPMAQDLILVKSPPPFPLATYLVMVRGA